MSKSAKIITVCVSTILICLLVVSGILTGYSPVKATTSQGTPEKGKAYASSKLFDKVDKLADASQVIVVGTIQNVNPEYILAGNEKDSKKTVRIIQSEVTLKVTECLKGDIKPGELIKLRKQLGLRILNKNNVYEDVFLDGVNLKETNGEQGLYLLNKKSSDNTLVYYPSSRQSEIKINNSINKTLNSTADDLEVEYTNKDTAALFGDSKTLKQVKDQLQKSLAR